MKRARQADSEPGLGVAASQHELSPLNPGPSSSGNAKKGKGIVLCRAIEDDQVIVERESGILDVGNTLHASSGSSAQDRALLEPAFIYSEDGSPKKKSPRLSAATGKQGEAAEPVKDREVRSSSQL